MIWKEHGQLVEQWSEQTRSSANTLLSPSDWMVIRESDNGAAVPPEVKAARQGIREKCAQKLDAIAATATSAELAAYVTGPDYTSWSDPVPVDAPVIDAAGIDGVTSGAVLSDTSLVGASGNDTLAL